MSWAPIRKTGSPATPPPLMPDWRGARSGFSWDEARGDLAGLLGGGLNIGFETVDRHVAEGKGESVALRWLRKDGSPPQDTTYATLKQETDRFVGLLVSLGIQRGERVFSLLGRTPQLHVSLLGSVKAGAVFCPLFTAFGPEPVETRLSLGEARVLITTRILYDRKVAPIRDGLPALEHVLLVDGGPSPPPGTRDLTAALEAVEHRPTIAATSPDDPALLHFTSGTTGRPKGALHTHEAVVAHRTTGRLVLDLRPGDVFWCTADPGWVTGISYGVIAPLACGATVVIDEAEFDAERWCRILQEQEVAVWYTAPTAIRMLMRVDEGAFSAWDFSKLRHLASVGEPLNPEAVVWSARIFGHPFHDTWWQTETGAIMIANYRAHDVHPGAMGRPVPGITATVLVHEDDGIREADPDEEGELALRTPWPSLFRAYIGEPERYAEKFVEDWYLTGDLARRDGDGLFWFLGRADDVIKSAGHLISPFEVESVLLEHPLVAEAGVIGKPDETVGETVKAFVTLHPGHEADDTLKRQIIGHARKRLGAAIAPREIDFSKTLPKTRSGKIMRRLLKARELGLEEGDTSTLEDDT